MFSMVKSIPIQAVMRVKYFDHLRLRFTNPFRL